MGTRAVVTTRAIPAEGHAPKVPSVLWCGLLILGVKLALRIAGMGRTKTWIQQHVASVHETVLANVETLRATEYAVAMAGALYPGRALCLEQSLVLYYLLRKRGVGVELHFGVQAYPFLAHAWVEYRGEPINDVKEHVKRFAPLPDDAS